MGLLNFFLIIFLIIFIYRYAVKIPRESIPDFIDSPDNSYYKSIPILTKINGESKYVSFRMLLKDLNQADYICCGCGEKFSMIYQNLETKEVLCSKCYKKLVEKSNILANVIDEDDQKCYQKN